MTQRANGQQNILKLIESCSWSVIAGDASGAFWLKTNSKWFLFLVTALFTQFHALNEVDACLHQEQTSHTTPPRLWIDLFTFLFSLRICTRFGLARKEISLVNQVDHELETEFFARVARKRSQIRGIRSMRFVKFLSADYFPLDWRGVWLNFLAFVYSQFWTSQLGRPRCRFRPTVRAYHKRPSTDLPHHSSPPTHVRLQSPSASPGGM